jgi:hypothetical protein
MSTRMYGRHGPGAWKKWYERRYRQPPPPPSPRVVVVVLHVPPTIERVIVILMPDNDTTGQEPGSGFSGAPGSALATANSSRVVEAAEANGQMREKLDPLSQIGNVAYAKGNRQGTDDRGRQAILSVEELEDEAMRLSSDYAATENEALLEYDVSVVIDHYETRYKDGYLRGAKVKSLEELPPTWKRAIQQKAHRDKDLDERKGDAQMGDVLLGAAIENALDSLGIRSREQKQRVKEYVGIYLEAYEIYTPQERFEQDRGNSFRRS